VQSFGWWPVYGPARRPHPEIYEAAGYTGARVDQASAVVFTFVLRSALGPAASAILKRKLDRAGGSAEPLVREDISRRREYPSLSARLETVAAGYAAASENTFEFGLGALLDGLESELAASR
jgi:hypothetical protein